MYQGLRTQWISTQVRHHRLPDACLSIATVELPNFPKDKVF